MARPEVRPDDLCMGCMELRGGSTCEHCGWIEGTPPSSPTYLPPRTILDGRYLLGRVLGAGGFGITYLAWELDLDFKLAIKEYFPNACAVRDRDQCTVLAASTQSRDPFDHGLGKFLDEGRALARFHGHPSIASVMTFFRANGTSYLVMKYEDGITLQEYLAQHGGHLDFETITRIATPVMDALRAVHAERILHRDISPDNVIINRSGHIKILDFGSAKRDMTSQDRTLQITLKRGFSPEEQYRTDGKQGPWTDVYAVAATIYQCLTGTRPPDALERLNEDTLRPPSRQGVKIPPANEKALMKALSVRAASRFQTMEEFETAFLNRMRTEPEPAVPVKPREPVLAGLRDWVGRHARLLALAAGGTVLLIALLLILPALFAVPQIREFTADPATIFPGQSATLRWSVSGGRIAITPGIGSIGRNAGTRQILPSGTTVYTLTARGPLRSIAKSTRITVSARPIAINFTAEPPTIRQGESAELSWSVSGEPSTVTIDQGIGNVKATDHLQVSPTANTTYTLKAEGPGGAAPSSSVTVLIEAPIPKPVIVSLSANPPTIRKGQTTTLTWEVTGENAFANFDQNIGRVKLRDSLNVSPQVTTSFTLLARNPGGPTHKTVKVEVQQPDPPKIAGFTAEPASIGFGQSSTLSWSVSGEVDQVSISPAVGVVPPSGSRVVSPRATTNYVVSAVGPGGASRAESTVRVAAAHAPTIQIFSATPMIVAPRDPVVLRWKVDGDVDSVTLDPGGSVKREGSRVVAPAANTRYTITAQGPGGERSSSIDVQISIEAFGIVFFTVKPQKIKRGQSATLSWRVTGPVSALSIAPQVGELTRPAGSVDVTPDRDTEYVLAAQAGTKSARAKVKVTVKK